MNYMKPEMLDGLSERFVLGTMGRRARRRFGRLVDEEAVAAASVYRLEAMLLPAAWSLEPVQPSALVWRRIVRAAGFGRTSRGPRVADTRRAPWGAVASGLAIAVLVTTLGWWQESQQPPEVVTRTVVETVPLEPAVGVISDEEGQALWTARLYPDLARIDVAVQQRPADAPDRDYQLWVLREDGVPVSLGLLPKTGERMLSLGDRALDGLERGDTLAVSLEPLGGSPEDVPTGPVVYTATFFAP
jgi:anti-sigma-K factor RskA